MKSVENTMSRFGNTRLLRPIKPRNLIILVSMLTDIHPKPMETS